MTTALPDCSVALFGVSFAVALAKTPTVGKLLSTRPMASYPTLGPRSLLGMKWGGGNNL